MEAACDEASGGNAECNGTPRSAWVLSPTNSRHWLMMGLLLLWFKVFLIFMVFSLFKVFFFTVNAKVMV